MADIFVDGLSGSDSNAGTSTAPYLTLAKLQTVMRSHDRAYLCNTFKEYVTFLNLSGCQWLQWEGKPRWHVTGAKSPSVVTETDATNHIYTCTVPASLSIDYVTHRYTNAAVLDSYGRRKAFIGLQVATSGEVTTNAAANIPSFYYDGTSSLVVGVGTGGVTNTDIEYIDRSDQNGFNIASCSNCLIQGGWASRHGMRSTSGGYGFSLTTCTDCSLEDFLTSDSGYHSYGSIGNINLRNSFHNGIVHGSGPASTQQITFCDNTSNRPVQSPRASDIVFHTYVPLRLDGTQCTTVPSIVSCTTILDPVFTTIGPHGLLAGSIITISGFTGTVTVGAVNGSQTVSSAGLTATTFKVNSAPTVTVSGTATAVRNSLSIQAVYAHTGATGANNKVFDARFNNLTVYGYGQGNAFECNDIDTTVLDGTLDGREFVLENYAVLFTNCTAWDARNAPPVHCAYDRCNFIWRGLDYLGNSQSNPSLVPIFGLPSGFVAGSQQLYHSCFFRCDLPSGGSFATMLGTTYSTGNRVCGFHYIGCTIVWNIARDYNIFRSASSAGIFTLKGSACINLGTAAFTNDFVSISSGTASSVVVSGNWYYSAGSTLRYYNIAAYTGQTFASQLWSADASTHAVWNVSVAFASTTSALPVAASILETRKSFQTTYAEDGVNNVPYSGNYGAWQVRKKKPYNRRSPR